jgi:hypothetical protein
MLFSRIEQKIIYTLFGTNFFIGHQIKEQIEMLKVRLPPEFKQRNMDDLGCGDGKITLLLREVFKPRRLRGFDVNDSLIKRARNNGVDARIMDLNADLPTGELAVMWGVLHHLNNREDCIRKIKENYTMAFIREPLRNKPIPGFEMGQPLVKKEIEGLVQKYLNGARTFDYGHCIFICYIRPGAK